jgi:ComF family protein
LPLGWCEAWGEYRGRLARLLHALKFERHDFLDDALASLLEETLRARVDLAFDAVAAIPMSRAGERRRGYNQAELLGRALAARIGVPYGFSLLRRTPGVRATQSTLPKKERAANVRGAFMAEGVEGKAVLLVDDICTTGETLRSAARALLDGGATRVCAITVAKAV